MSAWMVTDAHVDLLATAYLALVDPACDPQAIGQQMLRDNVRSLRSRYPNQHAWLRECEAQAEAYRFRPWLGRIAPEMLSKQLACLDYQSCEFPEWPQSPSRRHLDALQWHCPKHGDIPRKTADLYPWGVDEHPEEDAAAATPALESAPEAIVVLFRRPVQPCLPIGSGPLL